MSRHYVQHSQYFQYKDRRDTPFSTRHQHLGEPKKMLQARKTKRLNLSPSTKLNHFRAEQLFVCALHVPVVFFYVYSQSKPDVCFLAEYLLFSLYLVSFPPFLTTIKYLITNVCCQPATTASQQKISPNCWINNQFKLKRLRQYQ